MLVDTLVAAFADDPSRVAVIAPDGARSWREIAGGAAALAAELDGDGAPVGVLGTSGAELLTALVGIVGAGRAVCTLQRDWTDAELAAALREAGVREVITPRRVDRVTVRRPPGPAEGELSVVAGDRRFYVGFTSGSSGRPRPFVRSQRSWTDSFAPAAELFGMNAGTDVVLPGDLQHSHFLFGALLGWSQGARLRLLDGFAAHRLAAAVADAREAVVYAVPTMIEALERAQIAPAANVRGVVVSGAKLEPHHWTAAARLWPAACVAELYGASETSFITVNRDGPTSGDDGLVGVPFPGVEIAIRPRLDDPPGVGLVHVRSPFLFDGYLRAGVLEPGVPADGFVTVGDLGALGPDGTLSLRGRASNLAIVGGRNVHPEEVEAALGAHPGVAGCVVVGRPHPYWGEELVACVVPAAGAAPDAAELRAFLRERLATYKLPRRWLMVDALPRTASGKTDRRRARKLV